MKVRAKWQIRYKNGWYKGGDVFEIDSKDYPRYKNDVTPKITVQPEVSSKEVKKDNPKFEIHTKEIKRRGRPKRI